MNKKLNQLLEPRLQLYFFCLVAFALVSAFFSLWLCGGELAVILFLFLYYKKSSRRQQKDVMKFIENITYNVDVAAKDSMLSAPMPMMIFRPDNGEIIWSNDQFLQLTGAREHLFDVKITSAVPGFSSKWLMEGKPQCPTEITVRDRRYLVFGHMVRTEGASRALLANTYWMDVTEFADLRDEYYASRPVVGIITIDNYEELMKGVSDNTRSALRSEIDQRLEAWTAPAQGLLCRYDRDRYLFVFEERHLSAFQEGKYAILDAVRQVVNPSGIAATLSIGLGKDGPTFQELFQYASLSVEMALSRGGDQVVVKNRFNFEFYGGRSKETEKRTKVKSRVMANALGQLISDASAVFVMGHKFPDLDAMGAAVGVCTIARKRGIPAYIIREATDNPAEVMVRRLIQLSEYEKVFLSAQDALVAADSRCLLVVVDTNRPEQVQSEELLASCNRVAVIDHHRRAATYIADAALNFHEPYASSASELVTELLQYLIEPSDLLRGEAEALLAGIVLDTKNFTMRTGGRTFEAAAFLRRSGADTAEVKKLFQNDLNGAIARYDIIRTAQMYRDGVAVAAVSHTVNRVVAAQAADELLNISGVEASFVLFPDESKTIISGRSMGEINVQVILERLGGGGNAAASGAQIPDTDPDHVLRDLLRSIDQYFEDE